MTTTQTFVVKITRIGKRDATYPNREAWIGRNGRFTFSDLQCEMPWVTGWFTPDNPAESEEPMMFFQVQLKSL